VKPLPSGYPREFPAKDQAWVGTLRNQFLAHFGRISGDFFSAPGSAVIPSPAAVEASKTAYAPKGHADELPLSC
jgi:hypothetical protein